MWVRLKLVNIGLDGVPETGRCCRRCIPERRYGGNDAPVIRERLLYFWSKGIRGADFFISAIGPALSVFGRHARVLRPDGSEVSVRDFLDIVRRESTAVALEQVLHGADLGEVDPVTQQYVTWVWSYSRAPLDAGEAIALCLATGASYDEVTRAHSIASEAREKSKKVVKLRAHTPAGDGRRGPGQRVPGPADAPRRPAPARRVAVEPEPDRQAGRSTAASWARPGGRRCGRSAKRSPSASPTATRTAASSSASWAAASWRRRRPSAPPHNRPCYRDSRQWMARPHDRVFVAGLQRGRAAVRDMPPVQCRGPSRPRLRDAVAGAGGSRCQGGQ